MSTPPAIKLYRQIGTMVKRLPDPQRTNAIKQWKQSFRQNAHASETEVPNLLKEAEKQAAFLRIITPKNQFAGQSKTKTFVYKKGNEVDEGEGTIIQKARVSNFDGKNLDPCQVKRHYRRTIR